MNSSAESVADFEFDVAISFLGEDLTTAQQFQDRLQPALRSYMYVRDRDVVTGTDGLETLRSVFRDRARISVVLYRDGWGETPWTGVEEAAIKDRCLRTRYRSLVLINLDGSTPPEWVPDTYIHFDLQTYSLEQLSGAIKARAQELGAIARRPTLADRAIAIEKRRAFDKETEDLLNRSNIEWTKARDALFEAIGRHADQVGQHTGWEIRYGPPAIFSGFAIVAQGQSMRLDEQDVWANTARSAFINLLEYNAPLTIRKPGQSYVPLRDLDPASMTRLEIRRLPELGWCWELNDKIRSTEDTAEAIVGRLLERVEKALPRPRRG